MNFSETREGYLAQLERTADYQERIRLERRARLASFSVGFSPIETMPFADLSEEYGIEGVVVVSDGRCRAVVLVRRGREPPEDPEDREGPDWTYLWGFHDATDSGDDFTWKRKIDFVPTLWSPLPR